MALCSKQPDKKPSSIERRAGCHMYAQTTSGEQRKWRWADFEGTKFRTSHTHTTAAIPKMVTAALGSMLSHAMSHLPWKKNLPGSHSEHWIPV
jgi:hypothetical protein